MKIKRVATVAILLFSSSVSFAGQQVIESQTDAINIEDCKELIISGGC